jgi:hypothetical protein
MGTFELLSIPVPVVGYDSLNAEPKGLLAQLAGQDPGWKEIIDHGLPLAVVMVLYIIHRLWDRRPQD